MRLYFNTSALNRPLDDLASERVRIEAEAMVALLRSLLKLVRRRVDASDLLITTDDRMLRRGLRAASELRVRLATPPEAVSHLRRRSVR
jgi:hypothetical protein